MSTTNPNVVSRGAKPTNPPSDDRPESVRNLATVPRRDAFECPDWSKIPFPVSCARCGHDLHGRSEPTCPACGLTFKWSDAVPIEELTCATCGYHLYGLTETRCPECGKPFTWDDALQRHHRQRLPLFEYQATRRPLRSFVSTWFRTLRPRKFWNSIRLTDPPRTSMLILTALILMWLATCFRVLQLAFDDWLNLYFPSAGGFWGSSLWYLPSLIVQQLSKEKLAVHPSIAAWILLTFGSLLIFQQSMRRHRIRNVQLVRVCVYSCTPLLVLIPFGLYLADKLVNWTGFSLPWWWHPMPWIMMLVIVFAVRSLGIAYRDYLRMPHCLAVAVASQAIAVLAVCGIELLTIPSLVSWMLYQLLEALGIV